MDIDEEFEALELPAAKESCAWDARAKITWGEDPDDVHTWLLANGIPHETANRIVEIAQRERAESIRLRGIRDLALGIGGGIFAAIAGISTFLAMKDGSAGFRSIKVLALICVGSFLGFMYSLNLTWRGAERLMGGSRIKGAVSDEDDS